MREEETVKKYLYNYMNFYYNFFDDDDICTSKFDFASKTNTTSKYYNCFYNFDKMSFTYHIEALNMIYMKEGLKGCLSYFFKNKLSKDCEKYNNIYLVKKCKLKNIDKIITIYKSITQSIILINSIIYNKNDIIINISDERITYNKSLYHFLYGFTSFNFSNDISLINDPFNFLPKNIISLPRGYSLKRFYDETEITSKFYYDKNIKDYCDNKQYKECITYLSKQKNYKVMLNHNTICIIFDHFFKECYQQTVNNDCYSLIEFYINEVGLLPVIDRLTLSNFKYKNNINKILSSEDIYINETNEISQFPFRL